MSQKEIDKMFEQIPKEPEGIDELRKAYQQVKFQLQTINDNLEGGLRSFNLKEMRNTYVVNAQDSLDNSYPFYVDFNIVSEMTKIVSVFVNFRIMNYRAYSTAAASGGGQTSSSGGGQTTSSGGGQTKTSSSGGGQTSSSPDKTTNPLASFPYTSVTNVGDENESGDLITGNLSTTSCATGDHTHTVSNHTHNVTIDNHTHTVSNHTHTVSDHTHDITYGIHEESNSPTINFYVSEDDGYSYDEKVFGPYTQNQLGGIEITSLLEGAGNKVLKFESDTRTRLSVQIIVKLDIKAR